MEVTKFTVGELAGIGCLVDSCRKCEACQHDEEHFCIHHSGTYGSTEQDKKTPTYGGYSTYIVVADQFALKVPEKFQKLEAVAPLFCAGITTYSPLRRYQDKVIGKKVGIVGFGGLGHMAVKFAVAMGAEVTVFSTSASKEEYAKKLGAKNFVLSNDEAAMKATAYSLDFILDTVSANHDVRTLVSALKDKGVLVLTGSKIGGIKETQEMIDFCAEKGIVCDVEVISADQINEAYERTLKSDVKFRFVIDAKTIHS